ncbi:MAG: NAD(P)/FAD-dependent oxidoreductase [Clostridiales bacterium]|nr:NAD(P)/FAD-dependent oxidoreductase [Clostridiales bacterium]
MTFTQNPINEGRQRRIAVIGAGASGLVAAGSAAGAGADVIVFEGQNKTAKKLRITGKGRCNVTNNCDIATFIQNVPRNPRFLYTALTAFSPEDTIDFFESLGVPLKTERGRRVFPASDRASDIVRALEKFAFPAAKLCHENVQRLIVEDGRVTGVAGSSSVYSADAVIVCTGGKSYPMTGSKGDGYRFASECGHTVTPLVPSLVPIEAKGNLCRRLQGLSLKNVSLKIIHTKTGKTIFEDFGEMMFTHFGLTGPMVLSASAHLRDYSLDTCVASIDLKPALDEETLDARLLSDFAKYANKDFINALSDLLPSKMIGPMVELSGIDPRQKVNTVTREERRGLLSLLKGLTIPLLRFRPIEEAIITSGGVEVKEINPRNMASKKVKGLYFAGEVIDVDAYTGGFNLQIAFSTGMLAGKSAACDIW